MSHKVTSENGSVHAKQMGQQRNNNQNFSCPLHSFFLGGGEVGEGGGNLFGAGCLLTFPPYRMGTYLRWALNRKNTVYLNLFYKIN